MATKLYLRNTTNNGITDAAIATNIYDMVTTAGASVDTTVTNTTASGTEIQATKTAGGNTVAWVSGRVPAGGFTLTTTDISAWQVESNMLANIGGRYRLFKYSGGTLTELGGGPFDDGVEMNTSDREDLWTGNPTDTAFAENDRIVLKYYLTNVGTMAGGYTGTMKFNAADAATGDSFLNIAETVTFKSDPVQSTLTGSLGFAGARVAATSKGVAGTASFAGAVAKATARAATGALTFTGSAAKTALRPMSASLGFAPDVSPPSSGRTLWLKADSLALNDGDPVSTWNSSGTDGRSFTSSGASRPVYHTGGPNGLPYVEFDRASSQYMDMDSNWSSIVSSTAATVFFVFQVDDTGANADHYMFGSSTASPAAAAMEVSVVTGAGNDTFKTVKHDGNYWTATKSPCPTGTYHVGMSLYDPVSGKLYAGVDTLKDASLGTGVACGTATGMSNVVAIGRAGGGLYLDGRIAEVIVYNRALNSAERVGVAGYLAQRHGMTLQDGYVPPVTRAVSHGDSGVLSFLGTRAALVSRVLAGALSFVGGLASTRLINAILTGALGFVGAVSRMAGKAASGTLAFAGAGPSVVVGHGEAGTLGFSGASAKATSASLAGALSFAGASTRAIGKVLTGALSFLGAQARSISRAVAGALSYVGSIATVFIPGGGGGQLYTATLTAALAFSGAVSRQTSRPLAAALGLAGAIGRTIARAVSGVLSFVGVRVSPRRHAMLTGSVPSASLTATQPTQSGLTATVSTQSLTGSGEE